MTSNKSTRPRKVHDESKTCSTQISQIRASRKRIRGGAGGNEKMADGMPLRTQARLLGCRWRTLQSPRGTQTVGLLPRVRKKHAAKNPQEDRGRAGTALTVHSIFFFGYVSFTLPTSKRSSEPYFRLVSRNTFSAIPNNAKHICIDKYITPLPWANNCLVPCSNL